MGNRLKRLMVSVMIPTCNQAHLVGRAVARVASSLIIPTHDRQHLVGRVLDSGVIGCRQ
jgi:hypothetical protein